MPVEIRVGPPQLVTHYNSTILVTDPRGEIRPDAELGLFCRDTRFVSHYGFIINGKQWLLVQSTPLSSRSTRLHFTNPELALFDGTSLPALALGFEVDREIGDGLCEDLTVNNYSARSVRLRLRMQIDGDFADLFDVRNHRYFSRGVRDSFWDAERRELTITYHNADFKRALVYRLGPGDPAPHFASGQLLFELELGPAGSWHTRATFVLETGAAPVLPAPPDTQKRAHLGEAAPDEWQRSATALHSSNYNLRTMYQQAVADLGALRMSEHECASDVWVPAAGVPWFVTLFGRDSLIVSYQNFLLSPSFAVGALTKLAEFQSTVDDPYRDAEPGKIMHEARFGELAHFRMIPHTPYYGTADATILYLIVLSELLRWTGELALLEQFREAALGCLSWIDRYGDRDGDGFQEYKTRSPRGYYNMAWKDASDAVVYPDGGLVKLPIATCELQGYVYDAKLRMAEAFEAAGDAMLPERLRGEAAELRKHFNEAFWLSETGFLAYCLDGDKHPVQTVASNPGHCLWSGIVEPEQAAKVAGRMFREDMWSGWGVRTLSAENPAYDPLEYQRGSVWPHDNGIIAAGLYRYGERERASRIATAILEAAAMFERFRLPELFAGFSRAEDPFPVQIITANTPQAWASGTIFHLVRTIVGLNPDALNRRLYLDPDLPPGLDDLTLTDLKVGGTRLSVRFARATGKCKFDVIEREGEELRIEEGPPPWFRP